MTSFSKWDRDAYRARVGEHEAARRRGAIMAEQWGYQLAEQRKRLGFTQAGLAEIMGVTPGRVSQIEHGEVSTVEALASYIAALGGKLELIAWTGADDGNYATGLVALLDGGIHPADREPSAWMGAHRRLVENVNLLDLGCSAPGGDI